MSRMINFGNGLQRKYLDESSDKLVSDADKTQAQKDQEALRKHAESKAEKRNAKLDKRDANRKDLVEDAKDQIVLTKKDKVDRLEQLDDDLENKIERQVVEAKEKTNHLAREHGLKEPDNPEALKHDRYHCYRCDTHLHVPDAYKDLDPEVQALFGGDEDVRHLCCYCFGKMEDGEIVKVQTKKGSSKKVRLMIYDPEAFVRENADEIHQDDIDHIENLSKERIAYYNSKIKKYEGVYSLIGKVKHDKIQEVDDLENTVRNNAPTRWNYGGR